MKKFRSSLNDAKPIFTSDISLLINLHTTDTVTHIPTANDYVGNDVGPDLSMLAFGYGTNFQFINGTLSSISLLSVTDVSIQNITFTAIDSDGYTKNQDFSLILHRNPYIHSIIWSANVGDDFIIPITITYYNNARYKSSPDEARVIDDPTPTGWTGSPQVNLVYHNNSPYPRLTGTAIYPGTWTFQLKIIDTYDFLSIRSDITLTVNHLAPVINPIPSIHADASKFGSHINLRTSATECYYPVTYYNQATFSKMSFNYKKPGESQFNYFIVVDNSSIYSFILSQYNNNEDTIEVGTHVFTSFKIEDSYGYDDLIAEDINIVVVRTWYYDKQTSNNDNLPGFYLDMKNNNREISTPNNGCIPPIWIFAYGGAPIAGAPVDGQWASASSSFNEFNGIQPIYGIFALPDATAAIHSGAESVPAAPSITRLLRGYFIEYVDNKIRIQFNRISNFYGPPNHRTQYSWTIPYGSSIKQTRFKSDGSPEEVENLIAYWWASGESQLAVPVTPVPRSDVGLYSIDVDIQNTSKVEFEFDSGLSDWISNYYN